MADARRKWTPSVLAAGIAVGMVWLSGAPFDPPAAFPTHALVTPLGDTAGFPRHFEWSQVAGAEEYEVSVLTAAEELVFRQRGPSTVLDVEIEPGREPPPGDYRWEVRALQGTETLARALGDFRVVAP